MRLAMMVLGTALATVAWEIALFELPQGLDRDCEVVTCTWGYWLVFLPMIVLPIIVGIAVRPSTWVSRLAFAISSSFPIGLFVVFWFAPHISPNDPDLNDMIHGAALAPALFGAFGVPVSYGLIWLTTLIGAHLHRKS